MQGGKSKRKSSKETRIVVSRGKKYNIRLLIVEGCTHSNC